MSHDENDLPNPIRQPAGRHASLRPSLAARSRLIYGACAQLCVKFSAPRGHTRRLAALVLAVELRRDHAPDARHGKTT